MIWHMAFFLSQAVLLCRALKPLIEVYLSLHYDRFNVARALCGETILNIRKMFNNFGEVEA